MTLAGFDTRSSDSEVETWKLKPIETEAGSKEMIRKGFEAARIVFRKRPLLQRNTHSFKTRIFLLQLGTASLLCWVGPNDLLLVLFSKYHRLRVY